MCRCCYAGPAGHPIAHALHGFLGDVIQDLEPFLSSESIRKGQRWESEIGKRLAETNYGSDVNAEMIRRGRRR